MASGRSLGISELAVPTEGREGWMDGSRLPGEWVGGTAREAGDGWSQGNGREGS